MTISFVAVGSDTGLADSTSPFQHAVTIPAGHATDDLFIMNGGVKPYTCSTLTLSGWTRLTEVTSGTTANAVDAGSVRHFCFTRTATSSSEVNPTVGFDTATNPSIVCPIALRKTTAGAWTVQEATGADTSIANTTVSVTAGSTLGFTVGNWIVVSAVAPSDAVYTFTNPISVPGCTLGTQTQRQTDVNSTAGNDLSHFVWTAEITAGTATGPAVLTGTAPTAAASQVAAHFLRIAEPAGGSSFSGTAELTGAGTLVASTPGGGGGQVANPTILHPAESAATRPWTSPTLSPSPNSIVMAIVANTGSVSDTASKAGTDATSTFATNGWNIAQQADPGTTASSSIHAWWAVTTASPGSGTITITTGATPAASHVAVIEATGIDTPGPLDGAAGAFDTTGAPTLTLGQTPATGDMAMGFSSSRNDSNGVTQASGMTLLINAFHANPNAGLGVSYRTGSTSTSVPFAGLNTVHNAVLAVRLRAGASSSDKTGSAALTGAGTLTTTGTPTLIATINLTGAGTLTLTPLVAVTGAAALTGSGTLTTAGIARPAGTISLTGAGTLTTSGVARPTGTIGLTGSGTLTTTATPATTGSLNLTGSGTLTTAAAAGGQGAVSLSGSGTLAAVGAPAWATSVNLTGSGTLTGSGMQIVAGTATLTGSGTLTTSGVARPAAILALSGSGTLSLTGAPTPTAAAALTGTGTLTATGVGSGGGVLTLSGTGSLTGSGRPTPAATAALSGSGTLTATPVRATATGALTLTGSGTLVGSAPGQFAGTANLTGSGTLTGAGLPAIAGTVALTGAGTLTATGRAAPTQAVSLTGSGTLTTAAAFVITGALTLNGTGTLTFVSRAAAAGVLTLTGDGQLSFTPLVAVPGILNLSGSGTLVATGLANVVVVIIPEHTTLHSLHRGGTLTPLTEPAVLRSTYRHVATLASQQDRPHLVRATTAATLA